jgi:hypothetical protein
MSNSDSSYTEVVEEEVVNNRGGSDTSADTIKSIISSIVVNSNTVDGVLVPARGAITAAAKKFAVTKQVASRIWVRAKKNFKDNNIQAYRASPKKKGRRIGEHLQYNRDEVSEAISRLPYYKRRTLDLISGSLGISKTTIHRIYRNDKVIIKHTNNIKPSLTDQNKFFRVMYCFDKVNGIRENGNNYFYSSHFDVHLDEKWFFITQTQQKMYLVEGEEGPERSVRNKAHIIKVMFLCAVARPRFDSNGVCTFDGKIGMWPFTSKQPAKRTSVNRKAGTIETKLVNVTYEVYLDYVLNKVIPAIKAVFPRQHNRGITIRLQHDNAPSHFREDDPAWRHMVSQEVNWNFTLPEQPANSPDTNILDLGFFRSIQSIQWSKEPATTIEGLVAVVEEAWKEYQPTTLDRIWLSHQACMNEIIQCFGGNHYKLPHIKKDTLLDDRGVLPFSLDVTIEAKNALHDMGLVFGNVE